MTTVPIPRGVVPIPSYSDLRENDPKTGTPPAVNVTHIHNLNSTDKSECNVDNLNHGLDLMHIPSIAGKTIADPIHGKPIANITINISKK